MNIEELTKFCKDKGFVFQSGMIYGGVSGFWTFGPLGVELFNNLKSSWWKHFVHDKDNMFGIDGSIITHPKVWKASGHLDNFGDLVLMCSGCKEKYRADHYIEDTLNLLVEGKSANEINGIIKEHGLKCPKCKKDFQELKDFNLLFPTHIGADETKKSKAYLRGETAQDMFTNFRIISDSVRAKVPFGIAQIGKCFRNEISPRDFIFRCREFNIAEFEFFIHPDEKECPVLKEDHLNIEVMFLDAKTQDEQKTTLKKTNIKELVESKCLGQWHAYWLAEQMKWLYGLGINPSSLKIREHTTQELSHYSSATFDVDYAFSFGSKEIAGNANRGQYDLSQHMKESKEKLELFDEQSKTKIVPRVIEPTFGMERVLLSVIVDSFVDDKERGNIVLKIHPKLAPIKVGVFPLVNKLDSQAREVYNQLKELFNCQFDKSGSVGRRYARADEIGIPYCVTFDFDSINDNSVTVRDRNTTNQIRVPIDSLSTTLLGLINGTIDFKSAGKSV